MSTTNIVITVDTEEEGLWTGMYRRYNNTVKNIEFLPKLQLLFYRYGVTPTYLIDYPVATNPLAIEILKDILLQQKCEIGAHLHPWCNPPFEGDVLWERFNTYLNQELQEKKLRTLIEVIQENFGIKPLSYRGGCWQISEVTLIVLERLGFLVDTSVVPLWKWDKNTIISYSNAPRYPYFPSRTDICQPGESTVLEVPVTVTFNKVVPRFLELLIIRTPRIFHLMGILQKFGLKRIWLRPGTLTLEEMKSVADCVIQNNGPILNITFHSSEIMPGASPYNETEKDVENFLNRLDMFLEYSIGKMGCKNTTLIDYRKSFHTYQFKRFFMKKDDD
ncbi:MAG: hypothetical protein FJZ16_06255 [Candidatus Omnitrophica bacterium]|nr:hypothetical protein [Candidatus Poribacteria bacterium]MBM3253833.1 hypothetical protein [Candidatus Omnitrophota bacterium]